MFCEIADNLNIKQFVTIVAVFLFFASMFLNILALRWLAKREEARLTKTNAELEEIRAFISLTYEKLSSLY